MVSVKEVSAEKVIKRLTEELKKFPELKAPEWALFVKTGIHVERKPENPDWWLIRAASILRKTYIAPGIGVNRLRTWYGGRKNNGRQTEHHADAGGKIIRTLFQQLEKAGLIKKQNVGRILTPKARSLVDKITNQVKGEMLGGPRTRRVKTEKAETASEPAGESAKRAGTKRVGGAAKKSAPKKPAKPRSVGKTIEGKTGEPESGGKG